MNGEHSAPSAAASRFIDGIYSYCDAWCARCGFQSRCRVFHDQQLYEAAARLPSPPPAPGDDDETGLEWQAFLEPLDREPTAAEMVAAMEEQARVDTDLDRDPVVTSANEYTEIVLGIQAGLDPLVDSAGDQVIDTALDTIGRLGVPIGAKVRRASRGRLSAEDEDDVALEDANRTAKLVRLLIRESREAWRALMLPGHAIGDGVPARMIARLDAIDEAMATRFPAAMDFVRPGLDESTGESQAVP
jgi:hypothetical protein